MMLDGNFYEVGARGWSNQGHKTVEFPGKINQLPVFSRCNVLLRNERQREDEENPQKTEQIREIHCTSFSLPNKLERHSESPDSLGKFKVKFLNKTVKMRHEPDISEFNIDQNSPNSSIQTMKINNRKSKVSKEQVNMDTILGDDDKQSQRQKQLIRELENQKLQRLSLQNDYNKLLKQALKNKFNIQDDGRKFSGSEENDFLGIESNTINYRDQKQMVKLHKDIPQFMNSKLTGSPIKKTSFIEDNKTQRFQTRPRISQVLSGEQSEQNEIDSERQEQIYLATQRRRYLKNQENNKLREKALQEQNLKNQMQGLWNRIQGLQNQINIREESYHREMMQRDLAIKEKQLDKIIKENQSLKNFRTVHEGIQQQQLLQNSLRPNHNLLYFILFVLGLLIAKVFLCS